MIEDKKSFFCAHDKAQSDEGCLLSTVFQSFKVT